MIPHEKEFGYLSWKYKSSDFHSRGILNSPYNTHCRLIILFLGHMFTCFPLKCSIFALVSFRPSSSKAQPALIDQLVQQKLAKLGYIL